MPPPHRTFVLIFAPSELIGTYRSQSELIGRYPISSDKFRLVPITSDTLLRTYHSPPPIPCPHFSAPTFPSQRTHAFPLPYAHHLRSAPSLPRLHTFSLPHHTHTTPAAHLRALFCGGDGALVRWERSGSPIRTNRCSYAVRAFVRRCLGKVYRDFLVSGYLAEK